MISPVLLEVCVDSVRSARQAFAGGAARVELCSALLEGGLTPSLALIRSVCLLPGSVFVLIRPRAGDFVYTDDEWAVMLHDIQICQQERVDGVVIGALTPEGDVDTGRLREVLRLCRHPGARPLSVTFHRAIDMSRDPLRALQTLIQLGVDRVLSSGGHGNVVQGTSVLRRMADMARGTRLRVMAGGGVRADNVAELVRRTGVLEVHASARGPLEWGNSTFRRLGVYMGGEKRNTGPEVEYMQRFCDRDIVESMLQALRRKPQASRL